MRKSLWLNGIALVAAGVLGTAGTASASLSGVMDHDATFKVGVDIKPGTYTTTTAASVCVWARLSAITEDASAILQTGGAVNGKVTVEVKATDVAFYTAGCGTWTLTTTTTTGSSGSSNGSSVLGTGSSTLSS
ncbi:hypothetical protein LTV02_07075 [Nocardia yamanashiensis]|uniref:hypothetical protein n=1 Tax=Nocardia yamanashiensis TaxID=209247 RepID=UPI001E56BA56|nr:hypothetical protein [Nocardia yamanashiensis]UGT43145.1 hypothetical protein LTV02_07075 [Nocardia yamanashiensis]